MVPLNTSTCWPNLTVIESIFGQPAASVRFRNPSNNLNSCTRRGLDLTRHFSNSHKVQMTSPVNRPCRKKVAIVGSGSAGIAALWALNRTYHDVYIYEAAPRLGGHTNTAEWRQGKFKTLVDTGFIVMNSATYRKFSQYMTCARYSCLCKRSTNPRIQPTLSTSLRRCK